MTGQEKINEKNMNITHAAEKFRNNRKIELVELVSGINENVKSLWYHSFLFFSLSVPQKYKKTRAEKRKKISFVILFPILTL